MGQTSSHPVSLPPSHFLPIEHHALSDPTTTIAAPPPGCPMHKPTPPPTPPPSCPMHDPSKLKPSTPPPASCPIDHKSLNADLNPLNQMPELSQSPLSDAQRLTLSTDREVSTIPRTLTSDEDPSIDPSSQKWVYPSAQQFYNALVRKGQEAPEEDIESMVFVHNVLNELAWKEVLRWEGRRLGLPEGEYPEVELMRFKGRPSTLSPKAKAYLYLGYFFPESYKLVFFSFFWDAYTQTD